MVTSSAPTPWPQPVLEQLARVLGHTDVGLTGAEITQLLASLNMADPDASATKWKRLFAGFAASHKEMLGPKRIVTFITRAIAPVRYTGDAGRFADRQQALNEVLVHVGLKVLETGQLSTGPRASTLTEAAAHANTLRTELNRRGTHHEVMRYCTQEILERNAFHASLEAAKSVADRIRTLTGVSGDGSPLVDATLAPGRRGTPRIAINNNATISEGDEQKGFANLCRGLFSMFRNPIAHDPRINRPVSDDELLEVLTIASLIHRRLDTATINP